ncbi:MAG: AraC family transcriptional regulator [Methylococcales bacterium]
MHKTTLSFSKRVGTLKSSDALSQILNSIGISGSLLLKEEYCSPWAVSIPKSSDINSLLELSKGIRVAAFHLVERGHVHLKLENDKDYLIEAGEIAVCFSGLGHTIYQGESKSVTAFQDIMAGAKNIFEPDKNKNEPSTSLVCGVFLLHDAILNPLLNTLPQVLKLSVTSPKEFPSLYGVINQIIQEFKYQTVGSSYVIERYLEILCAETIRAHTEMLPEQATGWLSALKDPVIGKAIEAVHLDPKINWSVKKLASMVAMSPSRFSARFVSSVGESPMVYVTKWRMFIACKELKNEQSNLNQVANDVGYESLASFSRAFKRHIGVSPGIWRDSKKT